MKYKLIEELGEECPECAAPCGLLESLIHENEILKAHLKAVKSLVSPQMALASKIKAFPENPQLDPSEYSNRL